MDKTKIMDLGTPEQTLAWARDAIARIDNEHRQKAFWMSGAIGITCQITFEEWIYTWPIKEFFMHYPLGVVEDRSLFLSPISYKKYTFRDHTVVIMNGKEGTTATVYRTQGD